MLEFPFTFSMNVCLTTLGCGDVRWLSDLRLGLDDCARKTDLYGADRFCMVGNCSA